MNQEKIGKFIAKCRKDKKMTQSELAEKLGVTDKSIGNWENGRNMPDLSLCGDNAAMVGEQGYYEFKAGNKADLELNAYASMPIDENL